jgi:DNA-directed RNA polymerase III subunit RPC3
LILRINYEKCVVSLRNQRLVALANDRIGETTSLIYAQGLKLIEEKIERCRPDPKVDDIEELGQAEGPTFTTMELAATLSKSINAAKGIGKENEPDDNPPGGSHRGKRRRTEVDVDISDEDEVVATTNGNKHVPADNDDVDSLKDDPFADEDIKPTKRPRVTFQDQLITPAAYDDSENRLLQVKKHLQILEADECKFIRRAGSRGQGEWGVDFDAIIHYMQEAELDTMILENYGKSGHRLARMMRKLGKLDEKQLPTLALMKQKDIRTKLAEMQMAGVVDIQEVPRDAGRTTARTIFLWYFDTERVSAILLDGIYKSMSRCYQRLDVEKRRSHDILTLTERSDIRDLAPEQYLEPAQVNSLAEIRAREQSILGQIHRLDEMVGIFRDY